MNNIDILNNLSKDNKSDWLEKAKWRKDNKNWLSLSANIAINVLSQMDKLGKSKKELANELNISVEKLNEMLSGEYNFDIKTICLLEKSLGVDLKNKNI